MSRNHTGSEALVASKDSELQADLAAEAPQGVLAADASQDADVTGEQESIEDSKTEATEPIAPPAPIQVSEEAQISAATAFLQSKGFVVRKANAATRQLMEKADPDEVKAYFESTGLNRKELADAVGVTVSVIATVQNQAGDRWSAMRFAAAKVLIDAYVAAKAAVAAAAAPKTESEEDGGAEDDSKES